MRALDLFCGAGGASMGLKNAGFDVVGVDINPQKRYPFMFFQDDALSFCLDGFDFIWASPPCQAYSRASAGRRNAGVEYPDLIEPTREKLKQSGIPYVIENVPGAPIRRDVVLNGWMFPGLKVIRERWFECSFFILAPPTKRPKGLMRAGYMSIAGGGTQTGALALGQRYTADGCRTAMGIDWMIRLELSLAIPPQYSEFIANAFLKAGS